MAKECGKESCIGCEYYYEYIRYCKRNNCFISKDEEQGKR